MFCSGPRVPAGSDGLAPTGYLREDLGGRTPVLYDWLMPRKTHKPGEKAETSGQYVRLNAQGKSTGKEVTVVKGEPFPPTPKKRQTYRLRDKTRH